MATMAASSSAVSSQVFLRNFEGLRPQTSKLTDSFAVPTGITPGCATCRRPLILAQRKAIKKQQIILINSIEKLGKAGEVVTVKPGYFRNYLYPFGKAKMATPAMLKQIQLQKDRENAEKERIKKEAESIRLQFTTIGGFIVRRKQGKGKSIFGSVTTQDIADIIRAQTTREIERKNMTLPEIREVGSYICEIKLHPEVIADVKITVVGTK